MRFLTLAALLAAPVALAKSKAKVNTSVNPVKHLARSHRAPVAPRQTDTSSGEFCGTDDSGEDWYCEDPSTFCCTGPEIWQCAPIDAEECCTTGYYCESGEHCYLDADDEQLCLTPEEAEDMGGESPGGGTDTDDLDLDFGGGSDSDSDSDSTSTDDPEETTGTSDDTDDDDDSSSSVAGAIGGGKRKGGKGGSSGAAGKVGAGAVMAVVVAVGAMALV